MNYSCKEDIYMIILLPKQRCGLEKMTKNLSGEKIIKLLKCGYTAKVDVFIPKFKLESTHNLKNVLIKLGLTSAFGNANFAKITTDVPLKIDNVFQKAFIEVNEEGTEAAAATTYPYTPTSHPVEEETFLADHPFTFMLMKNSEILFCGIFQG
uniref:Serpin domain-containing protein n=1 Tax=Meloidogyne javanica TaxID=6303 RepID=A0A915LIM5_MELJA